MSHSSNAYFFHNPIASQDQSSWITKNEARQSPHKQIDYSIGCYLNCWFTWQWKLLLSINIFANDILLQMRCVWGVLNKFCSWHGLRRLRVFALESECKLFIVSWNRHENLFVIDWLSACRASCAKWKMNFGDNNSSEWAGNYEELRTVLFYFNPLYARILV